ncbi:hypothetical protein [Bradyrhizobium sp. USDA 4454]
MLSDLVRACQQIEADIATEEARTGIYDRSDARYPILARSLNERCANLKGTIATLEQRIAERSRHEALTDGVQRLESKGPARGRPLPSY